MPKQSAADHIGILMYASEQKSFPTYCNAPGNSLPFTTTPLSPAPIYIYWEQMLIQGGYVTTGTFDPKDTNKQWPTSGVWRCPSLTDDQVSGALGATGGGYGCTYPGLPVQFTGTPYAGGPGWTSGMFPIPPGQNPTVGWTPVLPPKPGQLTNSTVDLLVSDCGKPTGNETFVATNSIGQRPYGGYYPTDVHDTTGTNSTAGMPGLFHANRTLANICFADGHIESWTLKQLNADAAMSQQANIPNLLCRPMTHSNPLPIY